MYFHRQQKYGFLLVQCFLPSSSREAFITASVCLQLLKIFRAINVRHSETSDLEVLTATCWLDPRSSFLWLDLDLDLTRPLIVHPERRILVFGKRTLKERYTSSKAKKVSFFLPWKYFERQPSSWNCLQTMRLTHGRQHYCHFGENLYTEFSWLTQEHKPVFWY